MSKTTFALGFGDLLRQHRVAAGLTQETLAERARMSLAAVSKLERGTRQRPYRATIGLLADALGLSLSDRIEFERAAHWAPSHTFKTPDERPPNNLPAHLSSFVGRERELERIGEMLSAYRLVTLVAAGGVGKTRLAVRAAEDFIALTSPGERIDGIWFVDLAAVTSVRMTMPAVATSVGMQQCGTLEALLRFLRFQRFLLVLDNCEHVADEAAHVAGELLRQCPYAKILATGRQSLGLDGERIYRVPTLSVPMTGNSVLSPAEALEFSAIRLFVERAEAADCCFELTTASTSSVAEICRRLDGIALAIELAAARTNVFPTATIARLLDEQFLRLSSRSQSLLRHKTMRAVFEWSYDLLGHRERSVFRRLSVFVGGFTLELATSLWSGKLEEDVVVDVVASLVDKSLIQRDQYADVPRYKMLEPVRQYAREKLREHGEQDVAARAHASALLELAQRFDSTTELISDRIWDAYIVRERDNFRAAFEWALGPDGDAPLAQLLAGSKRAGWNGFRSDELRKWVTAAEQSCTENTPTEVVARLAIAAARAAISFGRDAAANLAASQRALDLQKPDDLPALASAKCMLGIALQQIGRSDDADRVLREARTAARSCGEQNDYSVATAALSAVRLGAGDLEEARALSTELLRQSQSAGPTRYEATAAATLAEIEFASGNGERAVRLCREAIPIFRSRSDLVRLSLTLSNVAAYLIARGRLQEARSYACEALRGFRAVGSRGDHIWAMQHLVAVALLSGDRGDGDTAVRRAAAVLGHVDEVLSRTAQFRYFTEQQEYEKILHALRQIFNERELATLTAAGKQWSEDHAIEEALAI